MEADCFGGDCLADDMELMPIFHSMSTHIIMTLWNRVMISRGGEDKTRGEKEG